MLSAEEIIECRKKVVKPNIIVPNIFTQKETEPTHSNEEKCQIQDSLSQFEEILSREKIKKLKSLSQAIWHPELNLAEVTLQIGSYWKKIGKRINNKLYLYSEEALYLLENGCLEITYNKVLMSIQRAYFVLLAFDSYISLEKYRVYSYLNSMGYKVLRHSSDVLNKEKFSNVKTENIQKVSKTLNCEIEDHEPEPCNKKLKVETQVAVENIDNKNMKQILKSLEVIHSFDVSDTSQLNFDFDVYLPLKMNTFKNEAQLPDSRIIVHRGCELLPDLTDLAGLTKKYDDGVPVINAIVFQDHISFYQIEPINLPSALEL